MQFGQYKIKAIFKLLAGAILVMTSFSAESQALNEQFNAGIPAGWQQTPGGTWTVHPTFGVNGSACIYTEELNTMTVTNSIKTSSISLIGASTVIIGFKGACTKNNFIHPNIAVFYEAGAGQQFVARWGTGFSPSTTYTIDGGFNPTPPLDGQNVYWFTGTHTLAVTGSSMNLTFSAELVNAGYVLLDSIVVTVKSNTVSSGIAEYKKEDEVLIFPNPANNKMVLVRAENILTLSLYDQLGKVLPVSIEQDGKVFTLDLRPFAAGVYYLSVSSTKARTTRFKMVID